MKGRDELGHYACKLIYIRRNNQNPYIICDLVKHFHYACRSCTINNNRNCRYLFSDQSACKNLMSQKGPFDCFRFRHSRAITNCGINIDLHRNQLKKTATK